MKGNSSKDKCKEITSLFVLTDSDKEDLRSFYGYDDSAVREAISQEARYRRFRNTRRIISVASVVAVAALVTAGGIYVWGPGEDAVMKMASQDGQAAGFNSKAYLELPNGDSYLLDGDGVTVIDNGSLPMDWKEHYFGSPDRKDGRDDIVIHKLYTGQNAEYRVVLADGTRVHMNSGTEFIYPAQFNNISRGVYLSGEAHFEVAKGAVPFIIKTDIATIKVLGTQFNLSCYQDDDVYEITLEEGSVRIELEDGAYYDMKPGEQFRVLNNSYVNIKWVDAVTTTPWRDGLFVFENESIDVVARKLSRWYEETVIPLGAAGVKITGVADRGGSVYEAVSALGLDGQVAVIAPIEQ